MTNRRKGELSPAEIDRGWPFQVALLAELSLGEQAAEQEAFCARLMKCHRGHSVFFEDRHYTVHCFATRVGAQTFMGRYGGEWFDPRDRGRGINWNKWFKGKSAGQSKPV
jgi:hypothetical protein